MAAQKAIPVISSENSFPFDNLYYQENGSLFTLPAWAKFFLELGESLCHFEVNIFRFTAAIAVPTRTYAAAFIAGGLNCGRANHHHPESDLEHFEKIWSLPPGTPLSFRVKDRKKKAIKRDNKYYQGTKLIGIQVDQGFTNTVQYIRPENVRNIEVLEEVDVKLPRDQQGRKIAPPSPLVKAIIGENRSYDFILRSRLECVIIGSKNLFRQELDIQLSPTLTPNDVFQGNLSDLLRVREFQPPGMGYRSSIVPAANKRNIRVAKESSPYAVIFDGSLGFIKWKEYWRNANQIIILDHTEPNFQFAVGQVNNEHLYRSEKQPKVMLPKLPSGIEMMVFTRDL